MWYRRIFRRDNRPILEFKQPSINRGEYSAILKPELFRQLNQLQIYAWKGLGGSRTGAHNSSRRKPSSEFSEYRRYSSGDDVRYVDWRASARQDSEIIRQGELEKDVNIYLLIDCSGSMGWGTPSKSFLQRKLVSMLTYLALNTGDRLYLLPYGGRGNSPKGPITGTGQYNSIIRYLDNLNYSGGASLHSALKRLKSTAFHGGIVIVLSDLLEIENLSEVLSGLPIPTWMVYVIHLMHPLELVPDIQGAIELEDIETRKTANFEITSKVLDKYRHQVTDWQQSLELVCVEHRALYTLIRTDESLEMGVLPKLRERKILVNQ